MYFPYEIGSGNDGKETPAEYSTRHKRLSLAVCIEKYLYYLLQHKFKSDVLSQNHKKTRK